MAAIQLSSILENPIQRVGQIGLTDQQPVFVEKGSGTIANTATGFYIPTKLQVVDNVHVAAKNAYGATALASLSITGVATLQGVSTTVLKNFAQSGGSATTIKLSSGASATNDIYNGLYIKIWQTDGDIVWAKISDYDGTSKVATLTEVDGSTIALGEVPTTTNQFEVLGIAAVCADPGNAAGGFIMWKVEGLL